MLLTLVYDSGMDERLTATLTDLNVSGWTKSFTAHGYGGGGYKLDSAAFPGTLNTLEILCSESEAGQLAAAVRGLQDGYRRKPGITIWSTPAREY